MITVETKVREASSFAALNAVNTLYGKLQRKLWVDLYIKSRPLNPLKSSYIKTYGISGRMFNSIKGELDGKYTAKMKWIEQHLVSLTQAIAATEKNISKASRDIKKLYASIKAIETYRNAIKAWRKEKIGKKPKLAAKLKKLLLAELKESLQKKLFYVHQKKRRLAILKYKREKFLKQKSKPSLCFGSKDLFKKQFHLEENAYKDHAEWLAGWQKSRSNQSYWIGSQDEKARNLNAQYHPENKTLSLRMPDCLEEKFGKRVVLSNVEFPYGQELFKQAYHFQETVYNPKKKRNETPHKPISYRILERAKSFYIQAIFEQESVQTLTSKHDGVIGLDLNADHIACVEIDGKGNLVSLQSFAFDFKSKSSAQIAAILGDHLAVICDLALKVGKSIAYEKLDFRDKKAALRERGGHRYAKMLSEFAYRKYQDILSSRAAKVGVEILPQNAAFTSVIGFYKYYAYKKLSSHEKAAFVIARRALRLSERVKTTDARKGTVSILAGLEASSSLQKRKIRHVWSQWRFHSKSLRRHILQEPRRPPSAIAMDPRRASGVKASFSSRCAALRLGRKALREEREVLNTALKRYQQEGLFTPKKAGCWPSACSNFLIISRFENVN